MKKHGISTRIGAIILAASLVAGDALPAFAAQAAGTEPGASTVENKNADISAADTSATEVSETEAVEETETSETEAVEETETSETESMGETEAALETETTESEEETEAETALETEASEQIEDTEEATGDDTIFGDEAGVSTVIGLKGQKAVDGSFLSDDGNIKKDYSYVNKAISNDNYILVGGCIDDWKDPATGFYKYMDTCYSIAYYSNHECMLGSKVVKVFQNQLEKDPATGFYVVDGVYYSDCKRNISGANGHSYYVIENNQVDVLGEISVSDTQDADAAAREIYGKKIADADASVRYYEANGKDYTEVLTQPVSDGKYVVYAYRSDEISFTRHHQKLTWKSVSNKTEIEQNGKLYYIGYQVRVNGTNEKHIHERSRICYTTADGQTFTPMNEFTTEAVYSAGDQNQYEVRAIYYTATQTVRTDKNGDAGYLTTYEIAKTGEWSAAFGYTSEGELQEAPAVTNLTGIRKHNTVELNWDEVPEATSYYVYNISSDQELALTDADWNKADYTSTSNTYMTFSLKNKYNYYRVKTYIGYANDTYKQGAGRLSDVVTMVAEETDSLAVPVTGLRVEAMTDGDYRLNWDELSSDTDVYLYYSTDQNAFSNGAYLLDLIDAEGTYVDSAYRGTTKTVPYKSDYAVQDAYNIAKKKVTLKRKYDGDEGTGSGVLISVPAGKTYYFVAVTVSEKNHNVDRSATTPYVGSRINGDCEEVVVKYGNYNDVAVSEMVSATGTLSKPKKPATKSEKNSITMTFTNQSGVTGYEIYKKNKKGKYKKLTTTTSRQYVDKNLKTNTTYSYKARAYVYNTVTREKIYSDYVAFSAETSTNNYIDVTAAMTGKNAVKLKWTKVAGAAKYEIYRSSTESVDDVYSVLNRSAIKYDGLKNNAKWKLVKTIGKAKTVSYTDKKLNTGETYSYVVVAYYKEGKVTKAISNGASVEMQIAPPTNVKAVLSGSKVKVTWSKNAYAKKYEVKYTKRDSQGKAVTDDPVVVSTKKTTVTISGLTTGEYLDDLRVRAFDGKRWSYWSYWSNSSKNTTVCLPAVKGVSAKNVTVKGADGSTSTRVQVSWKAVPGAAYYRVYWSTSPATEYDKDRKIYGYKNLEGYYGENLVAKESNQDEGYNNTVHYTEYKGQSGTIVGTNVIDYGQLQTGVTYYYFVKAYTENGRVVSAGYANRGAAVTFGATPGIRSAKAKGGKVTVSINKVAGARKYVVYRSTRKNKGFVAVGTTRKTSYVDKKVKKGKTYYYKVAAVGTNALQADFETGMSSAVKVKAK